MGYPEQRNSFSALPGVLRCRSIDKPLLSKPEHSGTLVFPGQCQKAYPTSIHLQADEHVWHKWEVFAIARTGRNSLVLMVLCGGSVSTQHAQRLPLLFLGCNVVSTFIVRYACPRKDAVKVIRGTLHQARLHCPPCPMSNNDEQQGLEATPDLVRIL